jgi:tetratricopeptide (TPR) repeat protein
MVPVSNVELVKHFLRGQNLEQLGRIEDAIALYETAVTAGFDSSGPYDRLIALYGNQARHREVIRVADSALDNVHTHQEKKAWYERMRAEAQRALERLPRPTPRRK